MIGSSERGYKDGSFQEAMFSSPLGVVICDTRIFVADTDNHLIRLVCRVNNLNVISSLTWVQTVKYKSRKQKLPLYSREITK